jgi:hypothetical protein
MGALVAGANKREKVYVDAIYVYLVTFIMLFVMIFQLFPKRMELFRKV